jgi:hypothetical protein
MAKASSRVELVFPADQVWHLIGGFGSPPDWLPYIPESELHEGGRSVEWSGEFTGSGSISSIRPIPRRHPDAHGVETTPLKEEIDTPLCSPALAALIRAGRCSRSDPDPLRGEAGAVAPMVRCQRSGGAGASPHAL